jgi:hypothetical protein
MIVMAKTKSPGNKKPAKPDTKIDAFQTRKSDKPYNEAGSDAHSLGKGRLCDTEARGHASPNGDSPIKLVVDASEGFVPLWEKGTTLRWRFRERSMEHFANPTAAKNEIRRLMGDALLKWGKAAPVRFKEDNDVWDFEVVTRKSDDCDAGGCVLASAFFPDSGRHELELYPILFRQSREEQVDTLIHEIGHIFGLRHFFAQVAENGFPSEIFGTHSKFTIMNYGELSKLTEIDKRDLIRLYRLAWNGTLTQINGTPIRLVKPFHTLAPVVDGAFAANDSVALQPQPIAAYVDGLAQL